MEIMILPVVGILTMLLSGAYLFHQKRKFDNGIRTQATIVDYAAADGNSFRYLCEYTVNGKTVRAYFPTTVNRASRKKIGKKIPISYDEQNPGQFVTMQDRVHYIFCIFFLCGAGLIVLFFAAL